SVEVFDCGGKNMNDLLFEMVLDFGKADALPQAIEKRAKTGELQSMSLSLIRQFNELEAMPEGWEKSEEAIKEWKEKTTIVTFDDAGHPVIDWVKLSTGSAEKINKA